MRGGLVLAGRLTRSALAGASFSTAVLLTSLCAAADDVWHDLSVGLDGETCTLRLQSETEVIASISPAPPPCHLAAPRAGAVEAVPRPAGFAIFVVGAAAPAADGRGCGRILTVVEVTRAGLRQGDTLRGVMPLCPGDAPEGKERSILVRSLDR
jgi:hypothetical protein